MYFIHHSNLSSTVSSLRPVRYCTKVKEKPEGTDLKISDSLYSDI